MQNGQVAEGGRIGMGLGMRGARGRRTSNRVGQYRTGQDRTYLTVGMQLQSERTRPMASVGPPSPGSHQQ
jgi:hypothetical protein